MNIKSNLLKIVLLLFLFFPPTILANDKLKEEYQLNLYKAKVIDVVSEEKIQDSTVQTLKIKILNKDYEGKESVIKNTLLGNPNDIKLHKGDKIMVHMEKNGNDVSFYFQSYDKSLSLLVLCILFIIFVIILGGTKGLKSILALVLIILLIIFGLVPLLLKGYSPIILSIITCVLSSVITFTITNGFTKKTLVAILGVSCGLLVSGLIAYTFSAITRITGFSSDAAQMLQYLPGGIVYDFKGLLFAGIIIGALGACMDVSMELTSSLTEIKKHHPKIKDKDLIISGLNIGKDMMGTMVNTLILAYAGGSLSTILIFMGFNKNFNEIINLDSITTEIIRSIAGSIGLIFAIPFTIFIFVIVNKKGVSNEKNI